MAGVRITQLPEIGSQDLKTKDLLVVVHVDDSTTRRTTVGDVGQMFNSFNSTIATEVINLGEKLNDLSGTTFENFGKLSGQYISSSYRTEIDDLISGVPNLKSIVETLQSVSGNGSDGSENARIDEIDNTVKDLRKKFGDLEEALLNVEAGEASAYISGMLSSLSTAIDDANATNDRVELLLTDLTSRIDEVSAKVEKIDDKYFRTLFGISYYSNSQVQSHFNALNLEIGNADYRIDSNVFGNSTVENFTPITDNHSQDFFSLDGCPIRTGHLTSVMEEETQTGLQAKLGLTIDSNVAIYANSRLLLNVEDGSAVVHCLVNGREVPFSLERHSSQDTQHDFVLKFNEALSVGSEIVLSVGIADLIDIADFSTYGDSLTNLIGMVVATPMMTEVERISSVVYGSLKFSEIDSDDDSVLSATLTCDETTLDEHDYLRSLSVVGSDLSCIAVKVYDDSSMLETMLTQHTVPNEISLDGTVAFDVGEVDDYDYIVFRGHFVGDSVVANFGKVRGGEETPEEDTVSTNATSEQTTLSETEPEENS